MEAVPSLKGNRIACARFKSLFEAGRLALRQAATPATKSEDVDEVLPDGTMQQLNTEWTKRYHLAFEATLGPSEQLRSRVYREWRKCNMSVLDVKKIRSVLSMAIVCATPREFGAGFRERSGGYYPHSHGVILGSSHPCTCLGLGWKL